MSFATKSLMIQEQGTAVLQTMAKLLPKRKSHLLMEVVFSLNLEKCRMSLVFLLNMHGFTLGSPVSIDSFGSATASGKYSITK